MDDVIVPDLLRRAAGTWPNRTALRTATDSWTFSELDYAADEIGGRVPGGARIAFRAEMTAASVTAVFGIPRGGGVAVPIDPMLGTREAAVLADSFGATLGWPPARSHQEAEPEPTPFSPALVVATSGTQGQPRGVLLTRGNIAAAAAASQIHLGTRDTDVWLLVTPLHHVSGLAILWRAAHDGSQVLLHDGFSVPGVDAALKSSVTWVSLVPTMLRRLLREAAGPWPRVRGALIGGAHSSPELIAAANAAGLQALPTYGMTETTAQAATVRPGNVTAALGTVGHPLPGVAITTDGVPGEPATILIDGPTVSPGYVGSAPRRGPLVTADVGFFDGSGRLVVVGRRDDMVITGGENVHPAQVEAALSRVPGVTAAAAAGVPDPEWGERLVALVSGSDLRVDDLAAALRASLPRHAVPHEIRVVARVPQLGNGKIDRQAVRLMAAAELAGDEG
jgi:O-succinylbenzoic acid--CoA ligase